MINIKAIAIILLLIVLSLEAKAQDGPRLWYGHSVQLKLSKTWRMSASQLFIFGRDPLALSSLQNSINLQYRVNKKLRVGLGYQHANKPSDRNGEGRNRITGRLNYGMKFQSIRIMNYFRAEWHFPERSKFQYRLRYGFRIHHRKWKLPIKARPFITNEFHYYLSGRPLWYRDGSGDRIIKQSPDGLHAHRLTIGLRITPLKRTNISLRFMRQTEFNLGNEFRKINVEDPRNGKVRRRFNNFSAFILTASHRFNL